MPGSADPTREEPSEPEEIIRVDRACRTFGALTAVSEVSFAAPAGVVVGLVGSDGAGKTTLLRMIAGMIPPSSGTILVGGLDVVRERSAVKTLLGYMPQRFGLYQDLTVIENLDFFMNIYGISGAARKARRERYLGFSNLLPFVDRKAGDLSGGMKQKLGLACVLVHEPKVLVLDEPTNGVDPVSRQEFWQILSDMKREGMAILVSTAYLDEGERCDRLLLMHNSRILVEAAPQAVRGGHPNLEEAIIHRIREADAALSEEQFGR
jgi:ABC-2 type transport system ATP-binding protein